jgi:insertion element IS1 protein InsB
LWEAIPSLYRKGHCFTDFWAVYSAVIPSEQHTAVGKETGETAHVERWNNRLRQRLARFVRMTLSFSKSVVMQECIGYLTHPFEKWIAFCCKCARSDLFTPEEMQFKQRKKLRTTFPVSANNDKEARH